MFLLGAGFVDKFGVKLHQINSTVDWRMGCKVTAKGAESWRFRSINEPFLRKFVDVESSLR